MAIRRRRSKLQVSSYRLQVRSNAKRIKRYKDSRMAEKQKGKSKKEKGKRKKQKNTITRSPPQCYNNSRQNIFAAYNPLRPGWGDMSIAPIPNLFRRPGRGCHGFQGTEELKSANKAGGSTALRAFDLQLTCCSIYRDLDRQNCNITVTKMENKTWHQ